MTKTSVWLAFLGAALALSACSSSTPTSPTQYGGGMQMPAPVATATPAPASGSTRVTISGFAFSSLTVAVGSNVTWTNADSAAHTATADSSSAFQWDTGNIAPGATSAPIQFNQAGTFTYHCSVHPSMHGTIVVQ